MFLALDFSAAVLQLSFPTGLLPERRINKNTSQHEHSVSVLMTMHVSEMTCRRDVCSDFKSRIKMGILLKGIFSILFDLEKLPMILYVVAISIPAYLS